MKLLLLFALLGYFTLRPEEIIIDQAIPVPEAVERIDPLPLQKQPLEPRKEDENEILEEVFMEELAELVEKEMELKNVQPMVEVAGQAVGPKVILSLTRKGTLTGSFKGGGDKKLGKEGAPDLEATAAWLKEKPKNAVLILRVPDDAPPESLIKVIGAVNKLGFEKVRIQALEAD